MAMRKISSTATTPQSHGKTSLQVNGGVPQKFSKKTQGSNQQALYSLLTGTLERRLRIR
jgi:hypothetical protein